MSDLNPEVTTDQSAEASVHMWEGSLEGLIKYLSQKDDTLKADEVRKMDAARALLRKLDHLRQATGQNVSTRNAARSFVTAAIADNTERTEKSQGEENMQAYLAQERSLIYDLRDRLGMKENEKALA